jgi:ArsR family transcriptional regulator
MAKYSGGMRDFIRITKALADPSRVRVLLALKRRELCVCQISELLQLAPSTISKHLSILNHAGLIESRKEERWVFYRLPDRGGAVAVREALDWVLKSLSRTAEAEADRSRLEKILKMNPSTICQRQLQR